MGVDVEESVIGLSPPLITAVLLLETAMSMCMESLPPKVIPPSPPLVNSSPSPDRANIDDEDNDVVDESLDFSLSKKHKNLLEWK
jgi:hypothetical protein